MSRRRGIFLLLAGYLGHSSTFAKHRSFLSPNPPCGGRLVRARETDSRVERRAVLSNLEAAAVVQSSLPGIAAVVGAAAAGSAAQLSRASAIGSEPLKDADGRNFFGQQRWTGRTIAVALVWIVLLGYSFFLAPGKSPDAREADQVLLNQVLSTPFDGSVSPLFVCIFNMLGIWPVIYSATLLPGADRQAPVPAYPFVFASFFLGAFALSPYLALREYRGTAGESGSLDWFTANVLESRFTALLLLAGAVYLALFALGNGAIGAVAPSAAWVQFLPVFASSLTAHVSSIDFMVLWMFFSPVLLEDGRRRGVFLGHPDSWDAADKARFAFCAAVPVFGGLVWLLSRPPLPDQKQ
ncbi:Hypothetical protein SCF082_LOCUS38883 [Durusdinium trenchii]|uniref:Uncharacterized protein n=1 Tax=Durusdinium trenchii TaxID=1381693 RepID=A0ABP0Q413_9DINO